MSKPDIMSMDITPLIEDGTNIITSYGSDNIAVNEEKFEKNIIVSEKNVKNYENAFSLIEDVKSENISTILIFGCNDEVKRSEFKNISKLGLKDGKTFEIMNLGAACRTFNVLVSEGRNVIAVLVLK